MKYRPSKKQLFPFLDEFWYAAFDGLLRAAERAIWEKQKFQGSVLDIGTGDGRMSKLLFSGKLIDVGIDPDSLAVEVAGNCGIYKKVLVASASKMPFKDESFSTVVSNSTFEHIKEDLLAVKEVSRVLKKNGRFLFTVPTPRFVEYLKSVGVKGEKLNKFNKRLDHYRYRTKDDWEKILEKNGLTLVSYKYYFPKKLTITGYILFKVYTIRPYKRELWSYLKDSPYGKLFPKRLIRYLLKFTLWPVFRGLFKEGGSWVFIEAKK